MQGPSESGTGMMWEASNEKARCRGRVGRRLVAAPWFWIRLEGRLSARDRLGVGRTLAILSPEFGRLLRRMSLVMACASTLARMRGSSPNSWPKDFQPLVALIARVVAHISASADDKAAAFGFDDLCFMTQPLHFIRSWTDASARPVRVGVRPHHPATKFRRNS